MKSAGPSDSPDGAWESKEFPKTYPKLLEAEAAKQEPTRGEALAYEVLAELKEENGSGGPIGQDHAYLRLRARALVVLGEAQVAQDRGIEALANLASPLECPDAPEAPHAACEAHVALLREKFPSIVSERNGISLVETLVYDDLTAVDSMTYFEDRAKARKGTVAQRVHVTAKAAERDGVVLKVVGKTTTSWPEECKSIGSVTVDTSDDHQVRRNEYVVQRCQPKPTTFVGATFQVHVPAADAEKVKLEKGEIVWFTFDSHALRRMGRTWDAGQGRVMLVE